MDSSATAINRIGLHCPTIGHIKTECSLTTKLWIRELGAHKIVEDMG